MRLLTKNEMKAVEANADKFGLSYHRMMENAGAACARNIKSIIEKEGIRKRNIVVVCGNGNNGGDGFVIARKFAENGYNVCVLITSGYPRSEESSYMFKMVLDMSIPTVWFEADKEKALKTVHNAEVIVDAVFGFSFYGELPSSLLELFAEMNNSEALKFSVDLPSGVYCDSGYMDKNAFTADYTIAISSLKPCHIIEPAASCCGSIIIANIGIPEECYDLTEKTLYTLSKNEVDNLLMQRDPVSHKGTYGHLLSICGSKKMPGAAFLSAKSALRSGVGLVTAAFPDSIYTTMSIKLNEALLLPLEETESGTLSKASVEKLNNELHKFSAILIGCGLSANEDTEAIVEFILKSSKVPVLLDADALNIIAKYPEILKKVNCPVILTPHPKEMSRLCGLSVEEVQANRVKCATDFSREYGVTVVLKGSNTIVFGKGSSRAYINATGNSGLAKGGSGDVLSGIIASFLAQGIHPVTAATTGVYIHGRCADNVADRMSQTGMLPTDVIDELANIFGEFDR